MDSRKPPAAGSKELMLFHGTKADTVEKINVQVVGGGSQPEVD